MAVAGLLGPESTALAQKRPDGVPATHCAVDRLDIIGTELIGFAGFFDDLTVTSSHFLNCDAIGAEGVVSREAARDLIIHAALDMNGDGSPLTRDNIIKYAQIASWIAARNVDGDPPKLAELFGARLGSEFRGNECDGLQAEELSIFGRICMERGARRATIAGATELGKDHLESVFWIVLNSDRTAYPAGLGSLDILRAVKSR